MLVPTASFNELERGFPIAKELVIVMRCQFIIFFVVDDSIAYRY